MDEAAAPGSGSGFGIQLRPGGCHHRLKFIIPPGLGWAAQHGRIPRIAILVALASRMQSMIESGQVETFQQLAELGRISQPRMTRIMSLLLLAPDIQEELLYLPEVMQGKATIHERLMRPLTTEMDWN